MTTLAASHRIVPTYLVGASFSSFTSILAAFGRFFASVAASQEIVRRHEDQILHLPDTSLAALGLDRDEIRRAIENGRSGH